VVVGQSATFTASVSVTAPGAGSPTGTVTFYEGGVSLGTPSTVSSGQASFLTFTLSVGSYSITAVYNGDINFVASAASPAQGLTVNKASTSASLPSLSPVVVGQSATFTASVSVTAPGAGSPTGTVTFYDGGVSLGTPSTVSSGQASFSTSTLSVGSHSITAVYSGDANFVASAASPAQGLTINQGSTTATLLSFSSPVTSGTPVTFTGSVSVTAPASGTPTGTVTFYDGGVSIGSGSVSSGQGSFTTSSLTVGDHFITATYDGDTNFVASPVNDPPQDLTVTGP